jgi:uncharacterized protein YbjT (DUF2867 family)
MTNHLSLVSGANGHLGNNLVRFLLKRIAGTGDSKEHQQP